MIVTQRDAAKIIAAHYGLDFDYRLTTGCTIGVRPVFETQLGFLTLAWRKMATGRNSAVRIGLMRPDCTIDWNWAA